MSSESAFSTFGAEVHRGYWAPRPCATNIVGHACINRDWHGRRQRACVALGAWRSPRGDLQRRRGGVVHWGEEGSQAGRATRSSDRSTVVCHAHQQWLCWRLCYCSFGWRFNQKDNKWLWQNGRRWCPVANHQRTNYSCKLYFYSLDKHTRFVARKNHCMLRLYAHYCRVGKHRFNNTKLRSVYIACDHIYGLKTSKLSTISQQNKLETDEQMNKLL